MSNSPFHAGEQAVQARLGVGDIEAWARNVVRPFLPEEHRQFHSSLPFLVAAARDESSRPWVTLLTGPEGFVASPNERSLRIDSRPPAGDALADAMLPGADLGLLGIEFETRRRNRVNGRVGQDNEALLFEVEQSFGNCPQYIHPRGWSRVEAPLAAPVIRSTQLGADQSEWIGGADTFFIASGHRGEGDSEAFGMDASHRGGDPGFVRIDSPTQLTFPDYSGNNHFNTLGNLALDPRAGLLFVDFESGSTLQLTGRAEIVWEGIELAAFPGARRLVRYEIEKIVELQSVLPLRFEAASAEGRQLRVTQKIRESENVTSFVFAAEDGNSLPAFEAGQHLPIELAIPGRSGGLRRTYSLSGPTQQESYRISVKRELHGVASQALHDSVDVGSLIRASEPSGDFVLAPPQAPTVLISAGVGVTPMLSMLHELVANHSDTPVWWFHGARDGAHHPLEQEVRALADGSSQVQTWVSYSQPLPGDVLGEGYDGVGRIEGRFISQRVTAPDAQYYLCGLPAFMSGVQSALVAEGVPLERIHTESFGPLG